jgi:hypothetical protein
VVDGKFEAAQAVRAEIRRAEQAEYARTAAEVRTQAVQQTQQELSIQQTAKQLEARFPQLDINNEEGRDETAIEETIALHRAFVEMGRYATPAEALQAAAELIALRNGYQDATVPAEAPAPAPAPAPAVRKTAVTPAERKAAAAAAQPKMPTSGMAGTPGQKAIDQMSEAEFLALPPEKLAELRGDIL